MKINSLLALTLLGFHTFGFAVNAGDDSVVAGQERLGGPTTPLADPTGIDKCRFISFSVPGGGELTALRINLVSLHHVNPPYTGATTIAFTAFEGQAVWVGPPAQYMESSSNPILFYASITRCTPHYQDWSTIALLHVTGSAIVPSSIYRVENVSDLCVGVEGSVDCLPGGINVSSQLEIRTTRWGDAETPFNPPSATRQAAMSDVAAIIKKFKSQLGALIKVRAIVSGSTAFGEITTSNLSSDIPFQPIAFCADAFRGLGYPFKMGKCATGSSACTTDAECTGSSAPPCNLYCP